MENTSALIIKANGTTTMAELLVKKKKKKKKEKRKRKKRKKEANGAVKRFSRRFCNKKNICVKIGRNLDIGLKLSFAFLSIGEHTHA